LEKVEVPVEISISLKRAREALRMGSTLSSDYMTSVRQHTHDYVQFNHGLHPCMKGLS
jgi:hypothetical protein